jgi:Protein of unknown function (DUF3500)
MRRVPDLRLSVAIGCVAALAIGALIAAERSATAMAASAERFLAALTADERKQAAFPFDAEERLNWHYIPRPRKGLPIKAMTEPQRQLARALLKTGLSQHGYLTATSIMDLETILGDLERRNPGPAAIVRDPELYFFSVFGTPSTRDPWGWRVEGHHVSLNFTVVKGTPVASTPWFFGTNPAEVKDGPNKGMRILAREEDAARTLLLALDLEQRKTAIIADVAPNDMVTANAPKVDPLSPIGATAGTFTPRQREQLMKLVEVYTSQMASDIGADRLGKLQRAGVEKIGFAWAGEIEPGKKHYYRIQGPTFLVEYDNTQNDGNHIHSVWRDFEGDFGRDLLREHLKSTPH